jgi:hypothetical protein
MIVGGRRADFLWEGYDVSPFRLTLFGGFDLQDGDGAAISIRSKKDRCLLAYLSLAQGKQTHRDILAELLWGERGDALKSQIEGLARDLQKVRDAVQQNQQAVTDVKASAEGGNSIIRSGRKDTSLSISGQVNRMVFYADDGDQARWFHADNDKSSTRLRLVGKSALDGDWSAGTNIEVQFESNSTGDVTIRQNTAVAASNSFTERKLELWFANAQAGKLTLGQGPTASDGSVEEDLSGTTVITNASFADLGGSLAFRVSGTRGTSTGVTVGGLLSSQGGLSRDDRIRYDSPTLGGAKLSTSWVDGDEWDVALRYGREFNGTELALAGGYSVEDLEANGREDEEFWQVKLGHDFKITDIGGTAVSLTYAQTDNAGATNREGTYVGLAAVQNVAKVGAEIYALFGQFDADLPGVVTEDITVGGIGARVKF